MEKVKTIFSLNGYDIFIHANYYKGFRGSLEEPREAPEFEIIEINIDDKLDFESVEHLSEFLECTEEKLEKIILHHLSKSYTNGKYF